MPILRLCANLHPMKRDTLPVRERTRRAIRDELTQLAKDLFVEKGYDETTIDDLAAAAGMSKRTFFRYFASKEELVMGKYEILGEQLAEDLAARPADEPIWASLRQVFGRVVEYFESEARGAAPASRTQPTHAPLPSSAPLSPASSRPGPPGLPQTRHNRSAICSTRQWTPSAPPDPQPQTLSDVPGSPGPPPAVPEHGMGLQRR